MLKHTDIGRNSDGLYMCADCLNNHKLKELLQYFLPALEAAIRNNPRAFIHSVDKVTNVTVEWTTASEHVLQLKELMQNRTTNSGYPCPKYGMNIDQCKESDCINCPES